MANQKNFDVIIIGGSYSGLAAAMALGRALKQVLVIDNGEPCNRQTPYSHNFITQDGKTPKEIAALAREQVQKYDTIKFFNGLAVNGAETENGFSIQTANGEMFTAKKLIFATGIKDRMLNINGFAECWGISVLHCPYCHGYEVRDSATGILGNGEYGFEFSGLISSWTNELTLYTNGKSTLTPEQTETLKSHHIDIIEKEIEKLDNNKGQLQNIRFKDGTISLINTLYTRPPFEQHCPIPMTLGCDLSQDGYIKIDSSQKTKVHGIYACGDNTSRLRTLANVVAAGTTTGMMLNREIIFENF